MGMRRDALDAVGGWDETMGWGHEEKELAERVLQEYDIYYDPEMVVEHVYAESLRDYWDKKYRLEKGTPYFLRKQGLSRRQILSEILSDLVSPRNYLGRSPSLTLARSGGTLTGTVGRLVGMGDERLAAIEDEPLEAGPWSGSGEPD